MAEARLNMVAAVPQSTVQAGGRTSLMRFGLPASVPMDRRALAAASLALGNDPGVAGIGVSPGESVHAFASGSRAMNVAGGGAHWCSKGRPAGGSSGGPSPPFCCLTRHGPFCLMSATGYSSAGPTGPSMTRRWQTGCCMVEARLMITGAGLPTTAQDGRHPGLMRLGVPASGPLDRKALAAASLAPGNDPSGIWIIAHSPTAMLLADPAQPLRREDGDRVRFRRIGRADHQALAPQVPHG